MQIRERQLHLSESIMLLIVLVTIEILLVLLMVLNIQSSHVMSSGKKMTGATHGVSDSIIYDTIEESLSNPVVSSSSYETPTDSHSNRNSYQR